MSLNLKQYKGIPLGLSFSIPLILSSRKVSYTDQGFNHSFIPQGDVSLLNGSVIPQGDVSLIPGSPVPQGNVSALIGSPVPQGDISFNNQ